MISFCKKRLFTNVLILSVRKTCQSVVKTADVCYKHDERGRYIEHCHECWVESREFKCGSGSDAGCLIKMREIEYEVIDDEVESDTSSEMPSLAEEKFEPEVYSAPDVADQQWLETQRNELDSDNGTDSSGYTSDADRLTGSGSSDMRTLEELSSDGEWSGDAGTNSDGCIGIGRAGNCTGMNTDDSIVIGRAEMRDTGMNTDHCVGIGRAVSCELDRREAKKLSRILRAIENGFIKAYEQGEDLEIWTRGMKCNEAEDD